MTKKKEKKRDWTYIILIIFAILFFAFMIFEFYKGGKEDFEMAARAGELAKKYCEDTGCRWDSLFSKCVC